MTDGLPTGWLADQLPRLMAEDPFMRRFMSIFEEIIDSIRDRVCNFDAYLDPGLAPLAFVRWTGSWLGLALDASLPEERQRELVRAAGPLFLWRGTASGLQGLLEAFTGGPVQVTDSGGVFAEGRAPDLVPTIEVRIEDAGGLTEPHIRELIALEVPVHAIVDLHVHRAKDADMTAVLPRGAEQDAEDE